MTDHITSLKEAIDKYEAWLAAGLPIDGGPYDTYPDDLYQAATRPEAIRSLLAALDEAQADARRWKTISQEFRVMSPNIDGQHCWVFRSSGSLRGPTMEAAVDAIAAQETPPADGGGESGGKAHFAAPKCLSENDYSVVDGGAGQGIIAAQEGGQDA